LTADRPVAYPFAMSEPGPTGPWRHAFTDLHPRVREGLTVRSRRGLLKAGLAGMAGISLPGLLSARAAAARTGRPMGGHKSVILLWMAGGPSHIDTWDPKPDAPIEVRGPFGTIPTRLPGVHLCEHYPKQAAMMDQFTLIRSMVLPGQQSPAESGDADRQSRLRAAHQSQGRNTTPPSAPSSPNTTGRTIPISRPTSR
jgi:hypothetical protein